MVLDYHRISISESTCVISTIKFTILIRQLGNLDVIKPYGQLLKVVVDIPYENICKTFSVKLMLSAFCCRYSMMRFLVPQTYWPRVNYVSDLDFFSVVTIWNHCSFVETIAFLQHCTIASNSSIWGLQLIVHKMWLAWIHNEKTLSKSYWFFLTIVKTFVHLSFTDSLIKSL